MSSNQRVGPVLCFGEVLLRLNPPVGSRLSDTSSMFALVGGAEANFAAALAQLGRSVEIATVLPENALGDRCLRDLRGHGIGTAFVLRRPGRLGLYFLEHGAGARPSRIVYDRACSAFAEHALHFDWAALAATTACFHVSGITLAVSASAANAARAACVAMRHAGVPISFDANHRASLWSGREEEAVATLRDMIDRADVVFASPYDIGRALGRDLPGDSGEARRAAAEAAFEAFPQLSLIASTRRDMSSGGAQWLGARLDTRAEGFEADSVALGGIIDRIGSGDAFAGALIDSHLRGDPPQRSIRLSLAAAVLKHGVMGDQWVGNREELEAFNPGVHQDVQR